MAGLIFFAEINLLARRRRARRSEGRVAGSASLHIALLMIIVFCSVYFTECNALQCNVYISYAFSSREQKPVSPIFMPFCVF